jgi:hypothetical protein
MLMPQLVKASPQPQAALYKGLGPEREYQQRKTKQRIYGQQVHIADSSIPFMINKTVYTYKGR